MPVWEYKTVVREEDQLLSDEQLNKIGAHGLELVAVVPIAKQEVALGKTQLRHTTHYFFKRPKKDG